MSSNGISDKPSEEREYTIYDGPLCELSKNSFANEYEGVNIHQYGPNKYVTTSSYKNWISKLHNFQIRDDDIWVATFPKSGTTWTQEIAWCIANDLNFTEAKNTSTLIRCPQFEFDSIMDTQIIQENMPDMPADDPCRLGETWKRLLTSTNRRIIKTHLQPPQLPTALFESKAKIIYICRDPKDACVSYYYFYKKITSFCGSFNDFVDLFLADLHYSCPYWKSILSFWEIRKQPNVMFITYEELKKDTRNMLTKISKFLGKDFNSEQIDSLLEYTTFENMKNNPSSTIDDLRTPFMTDENIKLCRKGKIGDWKIHMNEDQIRRFEVWTAKNLKDSDFPYYRNYQ